MKKIIIAALLLCVCAPVGRTGAVGEFAELVDELVKDVIEDRIENTVTAVGGNSRESIDLIVPLATGKPEAALAKIFDDYSPSNLQQTFWLKVLERMVPDAAAPIGWILEANQAVHDGTQAWLDWAIDNRKQDFKEMVVDRINAQKRLPTVADVDAAWNDYYDAKVVPGLDCRGVREVDCPWLKKEIKGDYAILRAKVRRMEESRNALPQARERVRKYFVWTYNQTKQEIELAVFLLKLAKKPVTKANIQLFLKDVNFHNELVRLWHAEMDKSGQPPAGDSPLEKAGALAVAAKKPQSIDYGPITREYGLNADRLLTNNITGKEYVDVRDTLYGAAGNLNSVCKNAAWAESTDERKGAALRRCEELYKGYAASADEIDKRLYDYAATLKSQLQALTMGGRVYPLADYYSKLEGEFRSGLPSSDISAMDSYAESYTNEGDYTLAHNIKYKVSDPARNSLEWMGTMKAGAVKCMGFYDIAAPLAESKGKPYQDRIDAFQTEFKANSAKYDELYNKSSNLAAFAGVERYDFSAQAKDLKDAIARTSSPGAFLSSAYVSRMRIRRAGAARGAREWEENIAANNKLLAAHAEDPQKAARLMHWLRKGDDVLLTVAWLDRYFDENYRDFIQEFLQGALVLLDEKTRGQFNPNQTEAARWGSGSKAVLDIAKGPCYTTLANHQAQLGELNKKLAELKELDLEGRVAKAAALSAAFKADMAAIPLVAIEVVALNDQLEAELGKLRFGIAFCPDYLLFYENNRCLSQPVITKNRDTYSARITAAQAYEKKALAYFNNYHPTQGRYNMPDEYILFSSNLFAAKKWVPGDEVSKAYWRISQEGYAQDALAYHRARPIKTLVVINQTVQDPGRAYLTFQPSELKEGKVTISGVIQDDVVKELSALKISENNGGSFKQVSVSGGKFEYTFPARMGVGYMLVFRPLFSSGKEGGNFGEVYLNFEDTKDRTQEISDFYARFKQAYESRSESSVMALISDSWEAGDGTTLADLEANLRASFRLYDSITCSISNIKAYRSDAKGEYSVTYDITITSRMFKRNLKHEEKSSVTEFVSFESGKPKIIRTATGRFWSVQ